MTDNSGAASIVRRLWHYCNVLRDDGLSYPDYVEQLTYLLFIKIADEQGDNLLPAEYSWQSFAAQEAQAMHGHYSNALLALGEQRGILGSIFRDAKNKISDPLKLRMLIVDLIGKTEWTQLSPDVKGDAYEGLLEKNARDTKSGAGQYFTPRPLIRAMVECISPQPGEVICDPACGTAGFLLAAHDFMRSNRRAVPESEITRLSGESLRGVELVHEVARLATMNLVLHGLYDPRSDQAPIICGDSLKRAPTERVDVVLTNPPFGIKGSIPSERGPDAGRSNGDDLATSRGDFWVRTSNKQLNFLQHVVSLLKPGGRAAIVLPDNVLFESGAAATIRRKLLESCDVHTLLRLPTGIFYAAGVKANVLFFDKGKPTESAGAMWTYDLRSDARYSLKTRPMAYADLAEFVRLYRPRSHRHRSSGSDTPRWRVSDITTLAQSANARMDVTWESAGEPERRASLTRLDELAAEIAADLQRALSHAADFSGGHPKGTE